MKDLAFAVIHKDFPTVIQDQSCALSARITLAQCREYRDKTPTCRWCIAVTDKPKPRWSWSEENLMQVLRSAKTAKEAKEKYGLDFTTLQRHFGGAGWSTLKWRLENGKPLRRA